MKVKERLNNFCKEFKERNMLGKISLVFQLGVLFFILIEAILILKKSWTELNNVGREIHILMGILGLYEVPLIYQFFKKMSKKEKELNKIVQGDMIDASKERALDDYDFVTFPEIIFESLLEKSSIIVILFINYFLMLFSETYKQDDFLAYSVFLGICLVIESVFKLLISLIMTTRCVIFANLCGCKKRKKAVLLK